MYDDDDDDDDDDDHKLCKVRCPATVVMVAL